MTDPRAALVEEAFENRETLTTPDHSAAVLSTVEDLDRGDLRVASPEEDGSWTVHAWIQKAVSLYFALAPMVEMDGYQTRYEEFVGGHEMPDAVVTEALDWFTR